MENLLKKVKEAGIIGAGGAGFPTYMKLNSDMEYLIINAGECEPLLQVDRLLAEVHTKELIRILVILTKHFKLKKTIIGLKKKNSVAINKLNDEISRLEEPYKTVLSVKPLDNAYPVGDEAILLYECIGKIVSKGAIPMEHKAVVMNLETLYNIYKSHVLNQPVTETYVTVTGEVAKPGTYKIPVGTYVKDAILMADGVISSDYSVIIGGVMTGTLCENIDEETVSKTTKGIIVLKQDHFIINRMKPVSIHEITRTMGVCSQCRACTDMCPRNLLGHKVEPHKVMNAVANGLINNTHLIKTALGCVSCGVCEMYACHHDLSPRKLMMKIKEAYSEQGIRPSGEEVLEPLPERAYMKVPSNRLVLRLGLKEYDYHSPMIEVIKPINRVKLKWKQHIGVPLKQCVKKGEQVTCGQVIGTCDEHQLGSFLHASIDGYITDITAEYISIERSCAG